MWGELEQKSLPCSSWIEQSSAWAEFRVRTSGKRPISIIFRKFGDPIGGIMFWEGRSTMGSYLTSLGGPVWISGEENEVGKQLAKSVREFRNRYLFVMIHTTPYYRVDLAKYGLRHLLPRGYSFVIGLAKSETDLWNGLEKRSRGAIKKARKNGLVVRSAKSFGDWEQFYDLQLEHSKIKGFQELAYDKTTMKEFYDLSLDSKCVLQLCLKDDKLLAATLWLFSRKLMVLHRNAWKNTEKLNANNLLFWESILWGKSHDFLSADLGGAPVPGPGIDKGIYDFKKGWGGERVYHNRYYQGALYGLAFRFAKQVPGLARFIRLFGRGIS
jgi:lipid II:glycine glycyltransferase (peptidoglycan interpeptide bridge formation enzyme)